MSDATTALLEPETESLATVERAGKDVFSRTAVLTLHMALSGISRTSRAFAMGVTEAMTTLPRVEYVENATGAIAPSQQLASELDRLLRQWREIRFEDGMENDVSRVLWRMLMAHSTMLIEALATIIVSEKASPRVAAEALRHIGRFAHPPSHRDRLWLLERALNSTSPLSRDGAGLGLAHLNDPSAIPYLKAAIQRESNETLKEDLKQVLDGLQRAKDAPAR